MVGFSDYQKMAPKDLFKPISFVKESKNEKRKTSRTLEQRARICNNFKILKNTHSKCKISQNRFTNSYGAHTIAESDKTLKQIYKLASRIGLGYSKVKSNTKQFRSTPKVKPSNSFKQKPSFQKSNKPHSNTDHHS